MNYTVMAVAGLAAAIAFDMVITRTRLLARKAFWVSYLIIFGFQLVVDGLLTGLHVVRYDAHRVSGLQILYAPIEDVLFGFAMVLVTLATWVVLGRRAEPSTPVESP